MSEELENRFLEYALQVRDFCTHLKKDIINAEYIRQLIRASGSIGSNYIEASDNLGKADERMKLKTSRREAKESVHWLRLVLIYEKDLEKERIRLIHEGIEIKRILSAIILKV